MPEVLLEVAVSDPRDAPGAAEGGADRLHVVVPGPTCGLSPEPAVVSSVGRDIHALHVGAERIGRYLQVYYEDAPDAPRWETTAMAVGPALPGGGIDPLFSVVFISATLANLIPAFTPGPTRLELAFLLPLHLAVVVRIVRARGAAARQRAVELESYRAIKTQTPTR